MSTQATLAFARTDAARSCAHCGAQIPAAQKKASPGVPEFCCNGCQVVFKILTAGGFEKYYELKRKAGGFSAPRPVNVSAETYKYLDDPEFRRKYAHGDGRSMDFYLEGVHCAACLWLVERLPSLVGAVESATLDMGRSVARVKVKPGRAFAPAAKVLESLGYKPHAVERDEDAERLQKLENRRWLVRIGVAGACAGNLMLMAVPVYSGADGGFAELFRWLSLALFLPVLFYSAVPFLKSAWASIATRTMSIDLPIVVAILFGSVVSVIHIVQGSDHVYFDSLAALVFLLLASRYVLRRLQQNAFQSSHLFQFLSPSAARRLTASGSVEEVVVSALKPGDVIKVETSEVLPADGLLLGGPAEINCALLTGESVPKTAASGERVFSGTVNEGAAIRIEVTATGPQTRLGGILKEIEDGKRNKARVVTAADKTAKWFLGAVLLAATAAFFFAPDTAEGFKRALALVIVTCPCALALATPLSMSLALGKAARAGILIKGAEALEKINGARNIALDKTGTLTSGRFEVLSFSDKSLKGIVCALELGSKHLIANALKEHLKPLLTEALPQVDGFRERVGQGVEGRIEGHEYKLQPLREETRTAVGIYRDGSLVGSATLGDRTRPESAECVVKLKSFGLNPFILSGDNQGAVAEVAAASGIVSGQALGCCDPESKKRFLENHERTIMVGDGANDAPALSSAFVGVAVRGSMEVSLRAADVYLTAPGLKPVVELVRLSRETMRTIHRNFLFSLLYNLAGGIAAATGEVTPLFAALLMPLSAFTVFASSLIGSRVKT